MQKKKIAVFISGRGSNFMAIQERIERGDVNGGIVAVISDNPTAAGLGYAREKSMETAVFERRRGQPRDAYFQSIMGYLEPLCIDLIVLAGFMKVLSANIIRRYENRIINIHPALLPSFPGVDAQKQALDYGVKHTGCTVHFVDEGVDTGPIIFQETVPVLDSDSVEDLASRILSKEHVLFPEAVRCFCGDLLQIDGRKVLAPEPYETR